MPLSKQGRTEGLERMASGIIAAVLADEKAVDEVTLADIEKAVRRAGQEFEQALAQEMVSHASEGARVARPVCAGCGQDMEPQGRRRKRVVSESGEVIVERMYYYCRKCQRGCFPPG